MKVDENLTGKGQAWVELRPDEGKRLVMDVPDCELQWDHGCLQMILPAGAILVVAERKVLK